MVQNRKSRPTCNPVKSLPVPGRETKGGLVQVTLTLEPADLSALREVAKRRATARKTARADVSEIVREAIRAWLKRHPKA
jgi:hypothetical protein